MSKIKTMMAAVAALCFMFSVTASAELEIGGDIKVLAVYVENAVDFNDDGDDQDDFIRLQAHISFKADLSDNVTTKVSLEVDKDYDYDVSSLDDDSLSGAGGNENLRVFLDEGWIQAAYLYDSSISAKIGRQYIEFGDGFVIGDSQPGRTLLNDLGEWEQDPFDAILVWYDGDDWVLNFLYAKTIETRSLDEDADLWSIYFSYTGIEDYEIDVYLILENFENDTTLGLLGNPSSLIASNVIAGDIDGQIYAFGARVWGNAVEGLTYKLEGVYEWGDIDSVAVAGDVDIEAWAVEFGIKYEFDSDYNPYIGFNYVYQSGDDDSVSATDDDYETYIALFQNRTYGEIFDPFTNGNMHIFNLHGGFDLSEDVSISAKYYYFMADEETGLVSHDDLGQELDLYLDYTFSEETKAVLAGGFFAPGDGVEDAYLDDDTSWFVRAGVEVEF